jgi:hypothetical protein
MKMSVENNLLFGDYYHDLVEGQISIGYSQKDAEKVVDVALASADAALRGLGVYLNFRENIIQSISSLSIACQIVSQQLDGTASSIRKDPCGYISRVAMVMAEAARAGGDEEAAKQFEEIAKKARSGHFKGVAVCTGAPPEVTKH